MTLEKNVEKFIEDVVKKQGYLYSTTEKLSSRLANRRMTDAVMQLTDLRGKKVIDIGCGDGTYTIELTEMGPRYVLGVDAADAAVETAKKKAAGIDRVKFEVANIYNLEPPEERYEVAIVRGILHHLYDVERAIAVISKMAEEIIVIEPNGYNPVLKIIEKTSRYHIEHEEKSYWPKILDKWFQQNGGLVDNSIYVGLVPMFCPDTMARICKFLEPFVEKTPLLRRLFCGQYVQKVLMK